MEMHPCHSSRVWHHCGNPTHQDLHPESSPARMCHDHTVSFRVGARHEGCTTVPLSTMRGPYDWPETYVPPVMISPPYATYHSVVKKEKDKIKEKEKDKPQQNVPEPSSLTLLGLGLILLLGIQYLFSRKRP